MIIQVHLHTILQRQTADGLIDRLDVTLPPGSRVSDLLLQVQVKFPPDSLLIAVNGRIASVDSPLSDGDRVNLMPAISGG